MNAPLTPPSQADAAGSEVSAQALAQAESYIEAEEGAANKFQGALAVLITSSASSRPRMVVSPMATAPNISRTPVPELPKSSGARGSAKCCSTRAR